MEKLHGTCMFFLKISTSKRKNMHVSLFSARALLSAPPYANILSRALEGIFRSLNNLMEVLHHSEFFYFTASRQGFISLGRYMPPFGLLLAPLILEISFLWTLCAMIAL